MDNELENHLHDSIFLIKEQARKAKSGLNDSNRNEDEFKNGHLLAYYSVISLLKNQAAAFEIEEQKLGLDDIEPDRDLL